MFGILFGNFIWISCSEDRQMDEQTGRQSNFLKLLVGALKNYYGFKLILSQPNNNKNPNNKTTITVVGFRQSIAGNTGHHHHHH